MILIFLMKLMSEDPKCCSSSILMTIWHPINSWISGIIAHRQCDVIFKWLLLCWYWDINPHQNRFMTDSGTMFWYLQLLVLRMKMLTFHVNKNMFVLCNRLANVIQLLVFDTQLQHYHSKNAQDCKDCSEGKSKLFGNLSSGIWN